MQKKNTALVCIQQITIYYCYLYSVESWALDRMVKFLHGLDDHQGHQDRYRTQCRFSVAIRSSPATSRQCLSLPHT